MYSPDPLPEALQWSEGMLLTPQHFQQNDIYWERRLRHLMGQLQPHYWGLLDLAVDRSALAEGRVRLERLECVMPDGLVVQYPQPGQDEVLGLTLSKDQSQAGDPPVIVSLVVPLRAPGAASSSAPIQRFDSVAGGVALDENTAAEQVPLSRLRPRLELRAGDDIPAKYVAMPLFKLERAISGELRLDGFHGPMLRLGASAFLDEASLQQRLHKLAGRLRRKAREVAGQTDVDPGDGGPRGLPEQRAMIAQLTSTLPAFEVLIDQASSHPFQVYQALAQLVGATAGCVADPVPMKLTPYLHQDMLPGFEAAMGQIHQVIDRLQLAYQMLAMEEMSDGLYEVELPDDWPTDGLLLEVRSGATDGAGQMLAWLDKASIGDVRLHAQLAKARVPGAEYRRVLPSQASGLPLREGSALVRLSNLSLEADGKPQPVLCAGGRLRIQGPPRGRAPQDLVLYRMKDTPVPFETRSEHMA